MARLFLVLALFGSLVHAEDFRGLWVTRWDYRSAADVARIMEEARTLGATDVIWQCRGQADAFYESDLEPWGEEIGTPNFDPLTIATWEAHKRGLRIHAWVNVFPLWKGRTPPADSSHPFHSKPAWRLMDDLGQPQALHDHYVIMNPVLPEVHDHITAVLTDIVDRYDVDGLHLDYVRFVSETLDTERFYPGDARSLAMFAQRSGIRNVKSADDRAAYRAFIRTRITELVTRIGTDIRAIDPTVEYSAAVWRRPELARDQFLQDAEAWLREGVLDRAMPMIYTDSDESYAADLTAWKTACPGATLTPGIGTYKHEDPQQTIRQIRASETAGIAIFAYASLFESADPNQSKTASDIASRAQKRREIRRYMIVRETLGG